MTKQVQISQGVKITDWVVGGKPSAHGVKLINNRFIPLKAMEYLSLQRLWKKLRQPSMFYHSEDNSIEFATVGIPKL